uniref:Uncharacterized protein n=1 Tax=Cucumis melo TaxID=3656 RepID=A0A9I9DDG9_CUCME
MEAQIGCNVRFRNGELQNEEALHVQHSSPVYGSGSGRNKGPTDLQGAGCGQTLGI